LFRKSILHPSLGGYISLIKDALKTTQTDVLCYGEGDFTLIELMEHYLYIHF